MLIYRSVKTSNQTSCLRTFVFRNPGIGSQNTSWQRSGIERFRVQEFKGRACQKDMLKLRNTYFGVQEYRTQTRKKKIFYSCTRILEFRYTRSRTRYSPGTRLFGPEKKDDFSSGIPKNILSENEIFFFISTSRLIIFHLRCGLEKCSLYHSKVID